MLLVSLYATYDIGVSLPKICGVVLGLGVFFAVVRYSRSTTAWWLSLVLFLGGTLGVALLGLLGTNWFKSKIVMVSALATRLPMLVSGLPGAEDGLHPNEVAGALLWGLPLLLVIPLALAAGRHKHDRLFARNAFSLAVAFLLGFLALFTGAVFVLAQSRGAYLALGITLVCAVLLLVPATVRKWALGVLFLLGVGFLFLAVTGRLQSLLPGGSNALVSSNSGLSLDTLESRVEIWSRAIYGIQDFPFTGMGMNTFRKVVQVLYPLFHAGPDSDIGHAHNEFLQAALDLGLPGLIAFMSIYISAFVMLVSTWKALRFDPQRSARLSLHGEMRASPVLLQSVTFGLGAGLFAHLLYGLTDAVALGAKPGILFWMLLGLITALYMKLAPSPVAQSVSLAEEDHIRQIQAKGQPVD
jgi:putative inorganic carbon (HCO3(-)) transporter